MRRLRILSHRFRSIFGRRRQEAELAREIEIHLQQLKRELISEGTSDRDADIEARRRFGAIDLAFEECRDARRVDMLENLKRDTLFALRLFRKSPGFTLTAIVSLALGIGANATIFQLFDAVRLQPLPVQRPEELLTVRVEGNGRSGNFRGRNSEFSLAMWDEFQRRQQTFSAVLAYGDTPINLAPSGEMRHGEGLFVSGGFFQALGIGPALGRLITPHDDQPGCGRQGVVISDAFWQREFAREPGVLNRKMWIEGEQVPILGVTPPSFFGVEVGHRFDVAMPVCSSPQASANKYTVFFIRPMGRLKAGITLDAAKAELTVLSSSVFEPATPPPYPAIQKGLFAKMKLRCAPGYAGYSRFRDEYDAPLRLLLAVVVCVLLLACANLANMMLARATAREHEFAVRRSLGASRWTLVRQLLMESLLLSVAGTAIGLLAAPVAGSALIRTLSTPQSPIFVNLQMNWRVFLFAITAGLAATMLTGLAPALRASRRASTRGASASKEKLVFRNVLLMVQIALCTALLTGSVLFAASFRNLMVADLGFQTQGVLAMNAFLDAKTFNTEARRAMALEELYRGLQSVPGVAGVAQSSITPLSGNGWDLDVKMEPNDQPRNVNISAITENYFGVLRTPLLAGRDFTRADRPGTPKVAIVNEEFARVLCHGQNPVGKTFLLDGVEGRVSIVGLARNARYMNIAEGFTPIVYLAARQSEGASSRYVIRAAPGISPQSLTAPALAVLRSVDAKATTRFRILAAQVEETVVRERMLATLTSVIGVVAMLLALTGIFGVTAYVVACRYREFGVRLALGATSNGIIRLVLGQLMLVLSAGVAAGTILAIAGGQVASSLLYGVQSRDPNTLLLVAALLAGAGMVAGSIPAWRASKIQPVDALRTE